jgi:hypothetical protein
MVQGVQSIYHHKSMMRTHKRKMSFTELTLFDPPLRVGLRPQAASPLSIAGEAPLLHCAATAPTASPSTVVERRARPPIWTQTSAVGNKPPPKLQPSDADLRRLRAVSVPSDDRGHGASSALLHNHGRAPISRLHGKGPSQILGASPVSSSERGLDPAHRRG